MLSPVVGSVGFVVIFLPKACVGDAFAARVLACVRAAGVVGAGVNVIWVVSSLGDVDFHLPTPVPDVSCDVSCGIRDGGVGGRCVPDPGVVHLKNVSGREVHEVQVARIRFVS